MNKPRPTPTIKLVIEVDSNREPIEGRLLEPSVFATTFRGWLSLAALIEAMRAQPTYPKAATHVTAALIRPDHRQR